MANNTADGHLKVTGVTQKRAAKDSSEGDNQLRDRGKASGFILVNEPVVRGHTSAIWTTGTSTIDTVISPADLKTAVETHQTWVTILPQTSVGTSATFTVTGLGAYSTVKVLWNSVSSNTASRKLQMRLGTAAGILTSGYLGLLAAISDINNAVYDLAGTGEIPLTTNNAAAADNTSGEITIQNFKDDLVTRWHGLSFQRYTVIGGTPTKIGIIGGDRDAATDIMTQIQLLWDGSGVFDDGYVTILGIK